MHFQTTVEQLIFIRCHIFHVVSCDHIFCYGVQNVLRVSIELVINHKTSLYIWIDAWQELGIMEMNKHAVNDFIGIQSSTWHEANGELWTLS